MLKGVFLRLHKEDPNQWRGNLNKTHFFQVGGVGELSRSSQGCLSVKSGNG